MKTAVYPGSFDPVTNGHLDIVARAARIFDRLIVAVYDTPSKRLLFSTERRVEMIRIAIASLPNVEVQSFSSLTVEYAQQVGARTIVRGLRAISDFELELQMAHMNRKLDPEVQVICMMTSLQYSFLSSSIVKEIAGLSGCVDGLVPPHVAEALQEAYRGAVDPFRK